MRRILSVLLLLTVAAALSACGIPVDDRAETLRDVPFGLLHSNTPEPPEVVGPAEGPVVQIYLVEASAQQLLAVERRLTEASLQAVVQALMDGPSRAERRRGLTTAFPNDGAEADTDLVGGVASVNLTGQFTALDGPTQRLAIAQIVLTLTGRPGVGRVAFTLEGQPIEIPRGDGTLATGSVSRDDYRELLPSG